LQKLPELDDIWVAGAFDSGDESADDGLLLHYDGTRWQRRPIPVAFGDSVYEAQFDAVDSGGFLLTASLRNLNAPRMARWDGTRWTPLPELSDGHRAVDVRAFAVDDIWVLGGESRTYHWNGTRWTKQPDAKGDCAGRVPAVRDGERGLLLRGNRCLTEDGVCVRIKHPRLPSTDGIRSSSQQSLRLNAIEPIPGTDKILGVGHVSVNQAGNPRVDR
jgi:hypothetical protein